ncbi:unnamed protein product, partial [Allacma fusca]
NLFSVPVISALWSILFGDKLKEDDPELWEAFHGGNSVAEDASISIFLPWFAKIAPKLSRFDKDQPRDFVDAYTDEVQKTTDPNSSFHKRSSMLCPETINFEIRRQFGVKFVSVNIANLNVQMYLQFVFP